MNRRSFFRALCGAAVAPVAAMAVASASHSDLTPLRRYPNGGFVRGGSGVRDDIRVMLAPSSYVIRRHEVSFQDLNKTIKRTGQVAEEAGETVAALTRRIVNEALIEETRSGGILRRQSLRS